VIASTAGRVALPAAFAGARRSGRPFVLWASLWRHPRTLAHMLSFPLLRHLYRESDAVLTYGPHVSAYVARVRGSEEGVFVAPQAVEPEVFGRTVGEEERLAWRQQAGIEPDAPLALFAGRLVVDKGVEVLLSGWRDAGLRGAALYLAGDGPLAQAARAASNIHTAGRVDRAQLAVAYAAADVVVVPSIPTRRFLEPWGLVCNEAMMQGTPVIATDAVGAAAGGLVKTGETGLVVPAGDPQALAEALSHLLGDAELRARLGARAREAVGAFSYERAADAFERALSRADYSRNR
jgi:glycosyltransferase involved in cell wall biosynthesis